MFSLIQADNHFGLLCVLFALVGFGFWSEDSRIGKHLSGVILVILAGMACSNLHLIPFTAPLYNLVWSYIIPLAIPLLLFRANLKVILPTIWPMLAGFIIAVSGTIAGALVAAFMLELGPQEANVVSTIAASWIGGSMNFAAMTHLLQIEDASLLAIMSAADNLGGTLFLILLIALPSLRLIQKYMPSKIISQALLLETPKTIPSDGKGELSETPMIHQMSTKKSFSIREMVKFLLLSAGCCLLGFGTANLLGKLGTALELQWLAHFSRYGILFITFYALLVANLFTAKIEPMSGDFQLGMFFMYLFFAVMGAGAEVKQLFGSGLVMVAFVAIMAMVHLIIVLIGAKLLRLDLAITLIVSNAVALGPATAAAQAATQRWYTLVTPAVMLGVFGYSVATFIGAVIHGWLA